MRNRSQRNYLIAFSAVLLMMPALAPAATTGFNQTTAGPFDYNDPANWVGGTAGDINGIWDSTLALTASQTVTFGADTVLATGLSFNYTGSFGLTLDANSNPASFTMTLGGDIVDNAGGAVTIGDSNNMLNVDLGGVARTFVVATGKTLNFIDVISDGSFTLTGGGKVDLNRGASAATVDISVNNASTLQFEINTSVSGTQTTTRAKSVTLSNANLLLPGHSNANSGEIVSGAVTIDGAANGGVDYVTLTPNAGKNVLLSAGSLLRTNHGIGILTGTNLGANSIASTTAGAANIQLTATPNLVGGGGALGSTTISIIPWAIGSTTSATGSGGAGTFVTYDATNGIHPLTAGEYATSISDGTTGSDNVSLNLASGSYGTITAGATINSLYLTNTSSATTSTLDGTGTLIVTSGALFLASNKGAVINCNLDFGAHEGVIGFTSGKTSTINGNIAGSGGLTLYQPVQSGFGTGVTLSGGGSTYTGDTYIFGLVLLGSSTVLPHGTRTGDVYVNASLRLPTGGGTTLINGLNGGGTVTYSNSSVAGISLGDNDANGNFTGAILETGGTMTLTKIGAGTQTLAGTNTYNRATTITGGTLALVGAGSINTSTGVTVNGTGASFITNSSVAVSIPVTITKGTIGGTGAISAPGGVLIATNAILSPGNSPGVQAYSTGLTWAGAGTYLWQINNASGSAGTNYDQVVVTSGLNITANSGTPFTIDINGLTAGNTPGAVPNFSNSSNYAWLIASSDGLTGFSVSDFTLATANFAGNNPLGSGSFSIHQGNETVPGVTLDGNANDVYLTFTSTPVPEPTSLALVALGAVGLLKRRRTA